jgi:signal transduction histidine kinase
MMTKTQIELQELRDQLDELAFFQQLDEELIRVLDVSQVADIAIDWALRRTAAHCGLMATRHGDFVNIVRVLGVSSQDAERLTREPWPIASGVISDAVKSKQIAYEEQLDDDPTTPKAVIDEKSGSSLTIPLIFKSRVIGVIHLESRAEEHFTEDMRVFMETFTPRIAIALQNAEAYTRTLNAERLKSDTIRMASHDLRNPLATITNALALLNRLDGQLPPTAQVGIDSIRQATNEMQMLIDELLTLERLESGIEMELKPVNLLDTLREALQRTNKLANDKGHAVKINCPNEPIYVRGEAAFYRQAMINLITNAIKYTPANGEVSIRLECHGSRIFFDVKDNGYGISVERQSNLFKRFYRAMEPATAHITGTGLGLSLVKNIVERGKGEVWFESQVDVGSTFGFWLPVAEDDVDREVDTQPFRPIQITEILQRRQAREARQQSFQ